ncbi:hypothetical protein CONLIGDRAFT_354939 [Coniochaeta ligniaria NRRL 30616]|uniref:Uncharacterized protein n=1 Tax=Coniochaeta ligniaria NRRL 30616 TaxID=1408157 RepID=A0A1J7IRA9_9PEZI|nr:hypothetical protein CONLIGDRAFT_354939 [Coniochaeta ligniaria NRRL 30616]
MIRKQINYTQLDSVNSKCALELTQQSNPGATRTVTTKSVTPLGRNVSPVPPLRLVSPCVSTPNPSSVQYTSITPWPFSMFPVLCRLSRRESKWFVRLKCPRYIGGTKVSPPKQNHIALTLCLSFAGVVQQQSSCMRGSLTVCWQGPLCFQSPHERQPWKSGC